MRILLLNHVSLSHVSFWTRCVRLGRQTQQPEAQRPEEVRRRGHRHPFSVLLSSLLVDENSTGEAEGRREIGNETATSKQFNQGSNNKNQVGGKRRMNDIARQNLSLVR